ncbi:hypothetical protein GQ457_13G004830 [Hibiscus cannabinus]
MKHTTTSTLARVPSRDRLLLQPMKENYHLINFGPFQKEHFTLILKNDTLVMSGRNRGPPPIPMKGHPHAGLRPPVHEPPYARGLGPMPPHPALLDEMRETQFLMGPRGLPPHPAILEERLAVQLQEIQGLLADNQGLAATHVALKQELEAAQHELQQISHYADSLRMEKDVQMREMYEKSVRLEADLRGLEAMRAELVKVNTDIKQLSAVRQDLTGQVQVMSQDLARLTGELQQAPVLKAEIENLKQELQRARAAIEYEKKGYAENYEHGQVMEKKLISMARELEKLRAEIANTEKGSRDASSTGGNPAIGGYNANYVNPEAGYPGNSYPVNYGMSPVSYAVLCAFSEVSVLCVLRFREAWMFILSMDLLLVPGVRMTCRELKDIASLISQISYDDSSGLQTCTQQIFFSANYPLMSEFREVMSLSGIFVSKLLNLPSHYATGLILVGCCPGATASIIVTYLARGNLWNIIFMSLLVDSVLTAVSTCGICFVIDNHPTCVMTPFLTAKLAGQSVAVDAIGLLNSTLQVVLLPILGGAFLNQYFNGLVGFFSPLLPTVAIGTVGILCGNAIISSDLQFVLASAVVRALFSPESAFAILSSGLQVLLASALLHASGFFFGYILSRALGLDVASSRTISIEVGMQNLVLGFVLATQLFQNPLTAVPCAVSGICHPIFGSVLAGIWRRDALKQKPLPIISDGSS